MAHDPALHSRTTYGGKVLGIHKHSVECFLKGFPLCRRPSPTTQPATVNLLSLLLNSHPMTGVKIPIIVT